ncbi:MAG: SiaB family protein kinase [Rhodospirillaceae bacterium]
MHAKDILQLRENLTREGVLFCYYGYITEDVLVSIGDAVRDKLALENTEQQVARGLFSIFVEQVQNIIRYSVERHEGELNERTVDLHHGMLAVGKIDGYYYILCGNAISNCDAPRLRDGLDHIKSLDRKELKALHKEVLKGKTPEGSKGAGVGFIDIARLATRSLEYDFLKMNEEHSYFVLKAYL